MSHINNSCFKSIHEERNGVHQEEYMICEAPDTDDYGSLAEADIASHSRTLRGQNQRRQRHHVHKNRR